MVIEYEYMKSGMQAIEKFLKEWKDRKEFEGAILCGSYAIGCQKENSDVDIMIVLSDETRRWERGNVRIDGYLIEYMADPVFFWKKSFKDGYELEKKVSVGMFAVGQVLVDKNGAVAKLKSEAGVIMKKPFKKMSRREIEMAKYHLYDGISKLESLSGEGFVKYAPLYYLHLSKIINFYASFRRIQIPATAKIYKFFNDNDFRERYELEGFSDKEFVGLVNNCFEEYSSIKNMVKLNDYVLDKWGGFNIDGWKLRTKIGV